MVSAFSLNEWGMVNSVPVGGELDQIRLWRDGAFGRERSTSGVPGERTLTQDDYWLLVQQRAEMLGAIVEPLIQRIEELEAELKRKESSIRTELRALWETKSED